MLNFYNKNNCEKMENPLFQAYRNNMFDKFCCLIKNGENINCINQNGVSLISEVIINKEKFENNKKYFDKLLKEKVFLGKQKLGYDALNLSIKNKKDSYYIIKLIEYGASVNSFGARKRNNRPSLQYGPPIFELINLGDYEKIKLLLEYNPNLDISNHEGEPILNYLFKYIDAFVHEYEWEKFIEIFIKNNAPIDERDNQGNEPIHYWAKKMFNENTAIKTLNLLLEKNANINSRDKYGNTPLIIASIFGITENVTSLIENSANLDIQNSDGNTAAMVSTSKRNGPKILNILEKNNANLSITNTQKNNVTHLLAKKIISSSSDIKRFTGIRQQDKYPYIEFLKRRTDLSMQKNIDGETAMDIIARDKDNILKWQ